MTKKIEKKPQKPRIFKDNDGSKTAEINCFNTVDITAHDLVLSDAKRLNVWLEKYIEWRNAKE